MLKAPWSGRGQGKEVIAAGAGPQGLGYGPHAVYSLCQLLSKSPATASHSHTSDPRKNISLSLFRQRNRTRERGVGGAPWFYPSPIFSSGFGSRDPRGPPAHLDTPDWLFHGDLREAQSWARPPLPVLAGTGKREGCELGTRHPCVYSEFLGNR